MTFKTLLKSAGTAIAVVAFGVGTANAQACEITELSSASGEIILEAQNALVVDDNPAAAQAGLDKLRAKGDLNCYEEAVLLELSASIKIKQDDYLGAANDIKTSLNKGYVAPQDRPAKYKALFQIYFQERQFEEGIKYSKLWLDAGGKPTRDEMWTFVGVYSNLENYAAAIPWAEKVYAIDGRNASETVTNSLIYFYDRTNQPAKKAALIERLLEQNPTKRLYWDAISGDYQKAGDDAKAFEVQKAMYLGGILQTEAEIERIVQYYNLLDAPYQAARILEKEMNAGRITRNYENLELLANLYQVAREHEKAIPVIQEAANISSTGQMFERLGRSYSDLKEWDKSEQAYTQALNKGGVKDRGFAWVAIGQSRYERDDRSGAREAFRQANNRGGRGWLAFMDAEEATAKALIVYEAESRVGELENEKKLCDKLAVLGEGSVSEECETLPARLEEAQAAVDALL